MLAVLLLDLGHVVPTGRLIDRVWGDDPPDSVRNVLYGYVARLRAALARIGDPGVTLARRSGGYLLAANPDQLDLCRFRRLTAEAAAASDDEAAALLRSALELWRGPALTALDSPWLRGMGDALELQRIAAVLDLGEIALRQGQHSVLASQLAEEAVAHPADERLVGQLMLALYRSGRQAEALHWFERTRRRLAEELGADPGPDLQALHERILLSDPSLAAPAPAGHGTTSTDRTGDLADATQEAAPQDLPVDITPVAGLANQAGPGLPPARQRPVPRRVHSPLRRTTILLALAAVLGVAIAVTALKLDQAPTVPISEQIDALDQQLGNAGPAHRLMILQRLMVIANNHPGTQVSNRVLNDLINFAVPRLKRPYPAGHPPTDVLYALQAIGGEQGNAFINTPGMTKFLNGVNLAGLNLAQIQLNVADLTGADLHGTDLYGAGLSSADLADADLAGADLSAAQLQHANLSGANLAGANLSGANLSGANLSGAKVACKALRHARNVPKAALAHCAA